MGAVPLPARSFNTSTEQLIGSTGSGGVHPVDVFVDGMTVLVLNFGDSTNATGGVLKAFTVQ